MTTFTGHGRMVLTIVRARGRHAGGSFGAAGLRSGRVYPHHDGIGRSSPCSSQVTWLLPYGW